ncbi:MAG: hypothetical protein M1814_002405 [Vezdaea aestivalis]|nr:MAG: hypothetical protein M1814_002405 [Vezdaea aestivalis]
MAGSALWREAHNTEGRVYYYNTQTNETQWTKPTDLMTPAEKALVWKEYTAEGGKKYWYNTETKKSSWEMPQEFKDAMAQETTSQFGQGQTQSYAAGPTPVLAQSHTGFGNETIGQERQISYGNTDVNGHRAFVPSSNDPEYASFEEAEAAFLKLLRRSGVQPDWSWEEAMRAVIKDPQYRAIKDPRDRKSAFEKYVVEVRIQEKDKAKERMAKLRTEFATMLKRHPEIKHFTRWKTARQIIEGESTFRSTSDETERRQLFEEYIIDLKKSNADHENSSRESALLELASILKALNLDPYTRWAEARERIQSSERFQMDEKFRTLSKSDILGAFESHIKALERSSNDARQQHKLNKARRERQNRDGFLMLLQDLRAAGKITAGTKWKQVYPFISEDQRYLAMLGQSGSTPIDLFWDIVEEEELGLRGRKNEILDILDDKRYIITAKTTLNEFLDALRHNPRADRIDKETLALIFERIREKAQRRSEDEKYDQERHRRHAIDALRSKIKHLHPPVSTNSTWESIKSRIEKSHEYQSLPTDELRRMAFEKVLRRVKEKEEDSERDRTRHREGDRSLPNAPPRTSGVRERDSRNGHSSRRARGSRMEHSPEADAYEDDRRRAQADRERQYRKASSTGLSPPPRTARGERSEREHRDKDRSLRHGSPERYDRHRRERDDDRSYKPSRGGTRDELDYGEGRLGSGERDKRRRARSGSDGSTGRDSKRSRRGDRSPHLRDRSPPLRRRRPSPSSPTKLAVPAKEEPALHSGSEEGEIEEE